MVHVEGWPLSHWNVARWSMHTWWQCHLIAQIHFLQSRAHKSKWIVGIICNINSTSKTSCMEKLTTFVKSSTHSSTVTSQSSCSVCTFCTWTSFCVSSPPTFFNSSNCPMSGPLMHNYIRCFVAQNMSTYKIQRMTTLKRKHLSKKMYLTTKLFHDGLIESWNYKNGAILSLNPPIATTHSNNFLAFNDITCKKIH